LAILFGRVYGYEELHMGSIKYKTLEHLYLVRILPLLVFSAVVLFGIFQVIQINEEYDDLESKLESQSTRIQFDFETPLWNVDYRRVSELIHLILADEDVVGINLYTEKKVLIESSGFAADLTYTEIEELLNEFSQSKKGYQMLFDHILYNFTKDERLVSLFGKITPIYYKTDGQSLEIGHVILLLSDASIFLKIRRIFFQFTIIIVLIFSLLSMSLILAYKRIISEPLNQLSRVITKASSVLIKTSFGNKEYSSEIEHIRIVFEELWAQQTHLTEELENSQKHYQSLLETLPIGIVLNELDGRFVEQNRSFLNTVGYDESDLEELTYWALVSEEDVEDEKLKLKEIVEGAEINRYDREFLQKTGDVIPVSLHRKIILNKDKNLILSCVVDNTERVKILNELQRSQQFLTKAASLASVGGWEHQIAGNSWFWTDEVFSIFEAEKKEDLNIEAVLISLEGDFGDTLRDKLSGAIKETMPFEVDGEITTFRGNRRWVVIKGESTRNFEGLVSVVGTIQDVTERKKMEIEALTIQEQLNHKSKIDMLGHLAGGVAHDFNNSLGGIINAVQLIQTKERHTAEISKLLEIVLRAANNAAILSRKMLTFYRKENYSLRRINLSQLVDELLAFLDTMIDKKTRVIFHNSGENLFIKADYATLQNTILNVCINAGHSMPKGGVINIWIKKIYCPKGYCENSSFQLKSGNYAQLIVSDTGIGMTPEVQKQAFIPFFTTKEKGLGTGLGLASAYRTISEVGGEILIESTYGKGTDVIIKIPLAEDGNLMKENESTLIYGTGTILFVDDNSVNREVGSSMLDTLGYEVEVAENGFEALEIFRSKTEKIDLVIMDMIMPVMDGEEAFYEMKKIKTSCPIIICTGYSDDDKIEKMMRSGLSGILMKPYGVEEISQLIENTLKMTK